MNADVGFFFFYVYLLTYLLGTRKWTYVSGEGRRACCFVAAGWNWTGLDWIGWGGGLLMMMICMYVYVCRLAAAAGLDWIGFGSVRMFTFFSFLFFSFASFRNWGGTLCVCVKMNGELCMSCVCTVDT